MTIYLISVGLLLILGLVAICLQEGKSQRGNTKLTAEEQVTRQLLSLRSGLLALPDDDRTLLLRCFQQTMCGILRLNGISPTTSHLQSAPNKPVGLALADGKVHDGPRWG